VSASACLLLFAAAAGRGGRVPLVAGGPEEDPTDATPEACDSPDGRRWYAPNRDRSRLRRAEGPGLAGTWSPASEARGLNGSDQAAPGYTDAGRGAERWFIGPAFSQSPPTMKFNWRHAVHVRIE
jgi:hypothetical protein